MPKSHGFLHLWAPHPLFPLLGQLLLRPQISWGILVIAWSNLSSRIWICHPAKPPQSCQHSCWNSVLVLTLDWSSHLLFPGCSLQESSPQADLVHFYLIHILRISNCWIIDTRKIKLQGDINVKHPNQPRLSRTGDAPFLPPSSRPGGHFGGNLTSLDTKRQNHNSAISNQYDLYREATAFNKYTSAAFIFVSINWYGDWDNWSTLPTPPPTQPQPQPTPSCTIVHGIKVDLN